MDTGPRRPALHPLVATAAIAVIVLAAVGVTTMMMNRSAATPSPYAAAPLAVAPVEPVATPSPVRTDAGPESAPAVVARPAPRIASSMPSDAPPVGSAPVTPTYREAPVAEAAPRICRDCGVVASIRDIKVKGQGTGIGAVGGAVVGGLLGNMVGAGRGKALATVAGAVGGGLGGNAIEKNVRSEIEHQLVVRLEDGSTRTFTQVNPFPYAIGERVRIVNGHVERG